MTWHLISLTIASELQRETPMATCIIHIGMHKTGSTSIQHSLDGFQDERFSFASLGNSPNHSYAVYDLFTRDGERGFFDAAPQAQVIEAHERQLRQAIADTGQRDLIISGEQISSMHPNAIKRLHDFLATHFETLRVVSYVRPPASYLASAFQQRLKKRNPTFEPLRLYRSYRDTFGKFDEIFGAEQVTLWKFEPSILHNRCAVSDFCQRLAIALPSARIRTENESLSRQLVGLLYVYRKYAPQLAESLQIEEVEALNRRLLTTWSDRFALSPELTQAIHQHFAEDIGWMEDRLGQSLQEQPRSTPYAVNSEADLIHTAGETLEELCDLIGQPRPQAPHQLAPEAAAQLFHQLRSPGGEPQTPPPRSSRNRLTNAAQRLLKRLS
ncbi:hypothetical protein A9179_21720 [Pseudomonas alcaligenes]|uniref:Sulfotransferase family protein n=1 Tax=Aquipseudomonas alcaligenes TaxID=43263 RepID=A0ABR7S781_AQUAC|nr:hypothetical protein [Pseudomonas alcaligenes]MBC9252892.1 hypothetical protein [Pseudomonas alcaligenes]